MIAVIDTQAGNLFNINKIVNGEITRDPYVIERADKIVFPGVGSFSFVMDSIEGIKETIIEKIKSGIPYLGICLGLEVLYDSSEEGPGSGLSINNFVYIKKVSCLSIYDCNHNTPFVLFNSSETSRACLNADPRHLNIFSVI